MLDIQIGHEKRIEKYIINEKDLYLNSSINKKINILILSKHFGSYFDEDYHTNLAETSINSIQKIIPNANILIKKHPREKASRWDQLAKKKIHQ